MTHSLFGADRTTHLKIVGMALIAAMMVMGFGISARNTSPQENMRTAKVLKAGKPVMITSSATAMIR